MRFGDAPLLVDDVCDSLGVFVFRRARCTVSHADFVVDIAEQRERKAVFLGEFRTVSRLVEADADDLRVFLLVLGREVPEPGTFRGSARGVRFREKPEHDFLAAEIAQLHFVPAMIGHLEIGRRIANFQHR
jgi:hypothetical protein